MLGFQFNYLDFQDADQAFKGTATNFDLGVKFDGSTGLGIDLPLILGEAGITDELLLTFISTEEN